MNALATIPQAPDRCRGQHHMHLLPGRQQGAGQRLAVGKLRSVRLVAAGQARQVKSDQRSTSEVDARRPCSPATCRGASARADVPSPVRMPGLGRPRPRACHLCLGGVIYQRFRVTKSHTSPARISRASERLRGCSRMFALCFGSGFWQHPMMALTLTLLCVARTRTAARHHPPRKAWLCAVR